MVFTCRWRNLDIHIPVFMINIGLWVSDYGLLFAWCLFIFFLLHKLRQFLKAGGKMRPLWLFAGLAVLNAKVARQIWLKSTSLWAVGEASDNRYQTRPQPFDWCQAVSATAYKQQAMAENVQVGCYCGLFIIGIYISYSLTACMFCWFIIWVVSSCQVKAYAWYSIPFPGLSWFLKTRIRAYPWQSIWCKHAQTKKSNYFKNLIITGYKSKRTNLYNRSAKNPINQKR